MRADDLRGLSLFDSLSDGQLDELLAVGVDEPIEPGVDLFREGEYADSWWVLVDGALDLVRRIGREESVVGRMDVPGRWAGGFRAWDEHGVYLATGRGSVTGRLLRVPAPALRERFTAWFPFGVHLIEGLYGTARSIESTARQRSSLASLGTLAAGLAHELNNPAAAASRAVDSLGETCESLLGSFDALLHQGITADQFGALEKQRLAIERPALTAGPLALADREEAVGEWLDRRGVARPWVLGATLAAAGVDTAWCERTATMLTADTLEPGLEWVAGAVSMTTLLAEIEEATGRVSGLVASVRSYSQLDRASRQRIDVTEGLESTLAMLGHKLSGAVEVVREYGDDVPEVDAYAGELNQVWTNLIDNALDAMDGAGRLRVTTRRDDAVVLVEIGDTGPGLSKEEAARAFDAFFTTKEVGKGTGLGLDIARRIVVDRHRGTIEIDSRPDETVFRVRIPTTGG